MANYWNRHVKTLFSRDDKDERDQDHTDVFEPNEVKAIFSLPWFLAGTGKRNAQERFHQYCPFHYWAPLLGLLTGDLHPFNWYRIVIVMRCTDNNYELPVFAYDWLSTRYRMQIFSLSIHFAEDKIYLLLRPHCMSVTATTHAPSKAMGLCKFSTLCPWSKA